MGCDEQEPEHSGGLRESFSILERIEWAATASAMSVLYRTDQPFSILERIEWAATMPFPKPTKSERPFSILERIEWAAKLLDCAVERVPFQYPRTDRMGCDSLSGKRHYNPRHAFSILERIEWAATNEIHFLTLEDFIFQYPRTDRMGCDSEREYERLLKRHFQYPRTDRMGCDQHITTASQTR